MDKKVIYKVFGAILISFILMVAVIFILYPYISKEKYTELVTDFENNQEMQNHFPAKENPLKSEQAESDADGNPIVVQTSGIAEFDSASTTSDILLNAEQIELYAIIDELHNQIARLEFQVDSLNSILPDTDSEIDPAVFTERVKSLLNLEEGELAPILNNFNKEQLKKLYLGGGTLQREKILRSLKAEVAAELMKELMQ